MKLIKVFMVLSLSVLLLACGGGDGKTKNGAGQRFAGSETVYMSAPGVPPLLIGTFPLSISISGSTVTVTENDGGVYKGKLSNNVFVASNIIFLGDAGDGIMCGDATINYNGSVNGALVIGTVSGTVNCTQSGVTIPFAFSGSFETSALARLRLGELGILSGALKSIQDTM